MLKKCCFLLLIIISLLLSSCQRYKEAYAVKGELFTKQWNTDQEALILSGEWELYPYQFKSERKEEEKQIYSIRGLNMGQPGLPTYGTLKMSVNLPSDYPLLSLSMDEIQMAYRISVNQEVLGQSGVLGNSPESSAPGRVRRIQSFRPDNQKLDLFIEFSNFHHRDRNLPSIRLESQEVFERFYLIDLLTDLVFAGTFLAIGILYLLLYLMSRKDISALWFSLICFMIMLRLFLTKSSIIDNLAGDQWIVFLLRLEYISMILAVSFFYLFSIALFHNHYPYFKQWLLLSPSIAYLITCIVTPLLFFSRILPIYQGVILMTGGASAYYIVKAWRQKKEWAFYILIIILAMLLAAIMDILYYNHIITLGPVTGYAMYIGIMIQGIMLVSRFSRNQEQVRNLSKDYRRANMALYNNQQMIEEQNQRLNQLAFIDQLTQIPNRVHMLDILGSKQELARREGNLLSLFYVDIDNFKRVNDTLGQQIGDAALFQFAQHLKGILRKSDNLFRMTSDEFVILVESIKERNQMVQLAEKILKAFRGFFLVEEHKIYLSVSIGIAYLHKNKPNESINALIRKANIALNRAKEQGKNGYAFYTESMDKELSYRVKLEDKMRGALEKKQFQLYYQAQVDVREGKLHGFEALIRWNDPEDGLISPGQFIPLAEQSGLIVEIGKWTLQESCRQLHLWLEAGYRDFTIAVNLSARQFEREDLFPFIQELLTTWKIPRGYLVLELTENSLMINSTIIKEKMEKLKELGIKIAIDDFGTGYSNLSYLSAFPLDYLKIDKQFISNIRNNEKDRRLVIAIINIAHSLELELIAEGVEDSLDKDLLFSHGCYCIQGYLFSQPEPSEFAEDFFKQPLT